MDNIAPLHRNLPIRVKIWLKIGNKIFEVLKIRKKNYMEATPNMNRIPKLSILGELHTSVSYINISKIVISILIQKADGQMGGHR